MYKQTTLVGSENFAVLFINLQGVSNRPIYVYTKNITIYDIQNTIYPVLRFT
jgi:hypothetical protein